MSTIQPITLPKWGLEMTEGTVVAWHLPEGGVAEKGTELCDIETDKIVNTLDAERPGVLRRHVAQAGERLPVGALIGVIAPVEVSDAQIAAFIAAFGGGAAEPEAAEASPPALSADELRTRNEAVHATPLARRLANDLGIDLSGVGGTGKGGRVSQEDVERIAAERGPAAPAEAPAPAAAQVRPQDAAFTPFGGLRRSIGQALLHARRTVPHFDLNADVAMDEALSLRRHLNRRTGNRPKISINDFVLKAAAVALQAVPEVNVHVSDDGIKTFTRADISLAVSIEGGLITPVLRDVGGKDLDAVAREAAQLADRARARKLAQDDLEGGGFTVSNLGMFGVRQFDAIINPPQGAILAIGCVRREATETPSGNIAFRSVMTATLTCDHRAIDGATGARFLAAFAHAIAEPGALL